jgi:hypothetical protein
MSTKDEVCDEEEKDSEMPLKNEDGVLPYDGHLRVTAVAAIPLVAPRIQLRPGRRSQDHHYLECLREH